MFRDLNTVLRKEFLEFSRDSRTLKSMAAMLFGLPLLYVVLIGVISSQIQGHLERTVRAGIVGGAAAADLGDFLRENRIDLSELPSLDRDMIAARKLDLILVLPEDFREALARVQRPILSIWYDEMEEQSNLAAKRVGAIVNAWGGGLTYRQAILRGIDPALLRPIEIQAKSVKPEKGVANNAMQLFMSSLFMICFMGTYHLAIDSVAGEKERRTLEALLQTAVPRRTLMFGKWSAILVVALLCLVANAIVFKLLMELGPLFGILGSAAQLSWRILGESLAICIPVLLMATSLQFMVSTFSRTVKEAQTYAGVLAIVGFLPASFTSVLEKIPTAEWWPHIGQTLTLLRLAKDQPIRWSSCFAASAGALALSFLFLWFTQRHFHRESIVQPG